MDLGPIPRRGRGEGPERSRFPLGQVNMTPGVRDSVPGAELIAALRRHAAGDWGELDPEDKAANDQALREGGRILSSYRTSSGVKFWVITEHDRSLTTALLPEEY